jgi:4-amino-4-deoxy-L-arabinose transferase-like glycosyltransferase
MVEQVGFYDYPSIVHYYVQAQTSIDSVMLPPTRCVYIMAGWAFATLFHLDPQPALRCVAAIFSSLSFLLSGIFAFRLAGPRYGLIVAALMAVAPMELMLAHRELADGPFAFFALLCLWLLWENMQRPGRLGWLAVYSGALALMVLTKENAFFAAVGFIGILATSALFPRLHLGKPAWSTFAATAAGGVLGLLVLICLAGSPQTLIQVYRLLVVKAEAMSFAYQSGGGPWFRYIVDLMLVSPTVLLPAIGGIFALNRDHCDSRRQGIFLLLFILFSCAVMVNVRNGMNLRYATMWDMPLRFLAAGVILHIASSFRQTPKASKAPLFAAILLLALVCGVEFHQYWLLFIRHDIGDPVTQYLMYATEIIRNGPPH